MNRLHHVRFREILASLALGIFPHTFLSIWGTAPSEEPSVAMIRQDERRPE